MTGLISALKHGTFHRRLPALCLVTIFGAMIARAAACPANAIGNFPAYLAIGSGSCTLPGGMGTMSNIRFSTSATAAAAVPDPLNFDIAVTGSQIAENFNLPDRPTTKPPFGSITFNFAYTLTLPAGSTVNSAGLAIYGNGGIGGYAISAGPVMVSSAGTFCLSGTFTGLSPASCSGTAKSFSGLNATVVPGLPSKPGVTVTFPATTSMDVFETVTASGEADSANETQSFTINASASPSPIPAPPSLLLGIAGLVWLALYVTRRNLALRT